MSLVAGSCISLISREQESKAASAARYINNLFILQVSSVYRVVKTYVSASGIAGFLIVDHAYEHIACAGAVIALGGTDIYGISCQYAIEAGTGISGTDPS